MQNWINWTSLIANITASLGVIGFIALYLAHQQSQKQCVNVTITGIDEVIKNTDLFIFYPNPSNGVFTIQAKREGLYLIKNELGQTVQQVELNAANHYTTNIQNLTKGLYFIVGVDNKQLSNQKLVIR